MTTKRTKRRQALPYATGILRWFPNSNHRNSPTSSHVAHCLQRHQLQGLQRLSSFYHISPRHLESCQKIATSDCNFPTPPKEHTGGCCPSLPLDSISPPAKADAQMDRHGLRGTGNSVATPRAPHDDELRFTPRDQQLPHRTVQTASPLWTIWEPYGLNFRGPPLTGPPAIVRARSALG